MNKTKKLLSSKKGESLIESLISILIFSLLITTVTITIATALRITTQATQQAEESQIRVNEIIAGASTGTDEVTFTFTYEIISSTGTPTTSEIETSQTVQINDEPGKLAFKP